MDETVETPVAVQPKLVTDLIALAGVDRVTLDQDEIVAHVAPEKLYGVMAALRDDQRFSFEQLMDLCGVDWPQRSPRFDVVYNLLSVSLNQRVRVVTMLDEEMPAPSLCALWPVATWWERECWDMFGIRFAGQTDHRRILTDYGFEGHPLRKDFPLTGYVEMRYDQERKQVVYEPVTLPQDFRNFDFESPWEGVVTLPGDEKAHLARIEESAPKAETGKTP